MSNTFHSRKYAAGTAEPSPVVLSIAQDALIVTDTDEVIPFEDLELTLAGHSKDRVKLRDHSTGNVYLCDDTNFLTTLANCQSSSKLVKQAQHTCRKMGSFFGSGAAGWIAALIVVGFIGAIFLCSVDLAATLAMSRIDPSLEQKIGEMVVDTSKLDSKSVAAQRVQRIGERLVAQIDKSPYTFHFFVKEDPDINACAYPGGYLVVNSGLVKQAKSDDELAGVIGHEIGHVLNRDSLKESLHNAGVTVCLGLVAGGLSSAERTDEFAKSLLLAQKLDQLRYSRYQESMADLAGLKLAVDAGYNGRGLLEFFAQLQAEDTGGNNKMYAILSTHPMTSDRITAIEDELERIKKAQTPDGDADASNN